MPTVPNEDRKINGFGSISEIVFSEDRLTAFGGANLLKGWLNRLGLSQLLSKHLSLPYEGKRYTVAQLVLSMIIGTILGGVSLRDMKWLGKDAVLLRLLSWETFPHPSTLSRFLSRFRMPTAKELMEANAQLVRQLWAHPYGRMTLDLDSHVMTVFGEQGYARSGYNDAKRGRGSYHPLLCFIAETRDLLWARYRPGNTNDNSGLTEFFRQVRGALPDGVASLRVRADAGFFGKPFFRQLEYHTVRYVIKGKWYGNVTAALPSLQWRPIGGGFDVAHTRLKLSGWKRARRFVFVREHLEGSLEPEQLRLDGVDHKHYRYRVFVTNWQAPAEQIWRFYRPRANCENYIREAKYDLGLDWTPSQRYGGNAAFFYMRWLAYNAMNAFRRQLLAQQEQVSFCKTLRRQFFCIPGRLVRSGRQWTLKLPSSFPWKQAFSSACKRLHALE